MKERYNFTMYHEDGTVVSFTGNKLMVDDILEDFKAFLLGCTFSPSLIDQICREEEPEGYNDN